MIVPEFQTTVSHKNAREARVDMSPSSGQNLFCLFKSISENQIWQWYTYQLIQILTTHDIEFTIITFAHSSDCKTTN